MKLRPGNMKWSDSILLSQPVQDVRLLTQSPTRDWREEVREREAAAYQRGHHDGEKTLRDQLLQQRSEMVEINRGVIESLRRAVTQVVQETEAAVINLALEAAQKVVAGMPVNAELIEAVVREALRQVEGNTEITIQLQTDDLALLRKHNAPLLNGLPDTGPLRFVASADVTRGGCMVQTRFGLIDARRETKIEQLREALSA